MYKNLVDYRMQENHLCSYDTLNNNMPLNKNFIEVNITFSFITNILIIFIINRKNGEFNYNDVYCKNNPFNTSDNQILIYFDNTYNKTNIFITDGFCSLKINPKSLFNNGEKRI